jgi:predicted metal-dependent HD superfamily phosphohydrolase
MTGERMHGEIAILLDADLSSLASTWSTFEQNQHNIILENGGTLTKQNLQKCGQFLRRFLHVRDCIYHTDGARERWEADAVTNILTWCQKYDVPLSTNV